MILQEGVQQFIAWTKRKIFHHFDKTNKEVYFREREVWWAALGKNIGYEMDGKNELFERPVLILKKYSKDTCFVIPFTTQIKTPSPWYQIKTIVDGIEGAVNLTQGRTISVRRLLRRVDSMPQDTYIEIATAFVGQFKKN